MYRDELKVLEILLNYAIDKKGLEESIAKEFESQDEFDYAKINLFNLISIYNLSSHAKVPYNISLDKFVKDGTCPQFKKPIPGLEYTSKKEITSPNLLKIVIYALKKGDYTFDHQNNAVIVNGTVTVTLSPEWLYRFALICEQNTYNQIYLYTKNEPGKIEDEKALLNYLYHSKSIMVSLGSRKECDLNSEYEKANNTAQMKLSLIDKAQLEDIKRAFETSVNPELKTKVSMFQLPNTSFILKKVAETQGEFYELPFFKQKKLISEWLLSHEMAHNDYYENFRKYLLLSSNKYDFSYIEEQVDIEKSILGLFCVYINLLVDSKIDLFDVSLTNFKLKKYTSPKIEKNMVRLRKIISQINKNRNDSVISEVINKRMNYINELRDLKKEDEISSQIEVLQNDIAEYRREKEEENRLENERKMVQNIIAYEQEHSLEDIAFDNESIVSLIKKATKSGRIYLDEYKKSTIVIELYSKRLGIVTFKTEIPLENFIVLVENINYYLEDNVSYERKIA